MPWQWFLWAPNLCGLSGLVWQPQQLGQEVIPVQKLPQNHCDLQNFILKVFPLPTSSLQLLSQRISYLKNLHVSFVVCLVVAFRFPFSFLTSPKMPSKSRFYAQHKFLGAPSREKATFVSEISPSSKSLQNFEKGNQALFWNRKKNLEFSFSFLREKNLPLWASVPLAFFSPCSWKCFYTNVKIN